MIDATDVVRLNDRIEKQRVYMFLAGLDPEFDKVRADVLRMDPFPGVEGAFAYKNHIRDACWRLIGYPEWYLEKRKKGPLKTGTASLASSSGNSSSTPYENLPSENEIPGSLTKKTEPPLRIYERQNKGKEKQGESVRILVVQPSSSPSPVRQSDSEVKNATEVTLEPSILSDDFQTVYIKYCCCGIFPRWHL
ncbi:hypothetical protein ACOSQ4_027962 [Xanthoceras sorbifolium]